MAVNSRFLIVGAGALVALLAAALLFGGGDSEAPVTVTASDQPRAEDSVADLRPAPEPAGGRDRVLELPANDHPLVWVKRRQKVQIHAAPGGAAVETVGHETEFGSPTVFAVERTRGEWAGVPNPYTGNGTLGWVHLDRDRLRAGNTPYEIVVDLSERRAHLSRGGETMRTFTVSIGAPETTTPTGRFAVTDTFRGDLNPAYGCCAVALTAVQPNLPSGWLGGNRIAIHGTSGPLGVPNSSGCVRAADRDVSALVDAVYPGAPVLIRE